MRGAGVQPLNGDNFLYSGESNYSFQRVFKSFDLNETVGPELSFWVNRRTREPFDALIVEARVVGSEDWTTLPDQSGHTSADQAASCWSTAWFGIFPRLVHYMTRVGEGNQAACEPNGTTGTWNAATGFSDGWEHWVIDLSGYIGSEVELSISYLSSRTAFDGVYIDDISFTADGSLVETATFETDLGGWTLDVLETTNTTGNNVPFERVNRSELPPIPGAIVSTEDTVLMGFGLEMLEDPEDRIELLKRSRALIGLPEHVPGAPPADWGVPDLPDENILYLPANLKDGFLD